MRTVARPRKLRLTRALSSCPACSVILHIALLSSTLLKYPLDSPRHLVARSDHRRELSRKLLYACCRRLSLPPRLRCTDHMNTYSKLQTALQAPDAPESPLSRHHGTTYTGAVSSTTPLFVTVTHVVFLRSQRRMWAGSVQQHHMQNQSIPPFLV